MTEHTEYEMFPKIVWLVTYAASSKVSDEWLLSTKSRAGNSTESESGSRGEHISILFDKGKKSEMDVAFMHGVMHVLRMLRLRCCD